MHFHDASCYSASAHLHQALGFAHRFHITHACLFGALQLLILELLLLPNADEIFQQYFLSDQLRN